MNWSSTARIYSVTDQLQVPTPPTIILPPLLANGQAYADQQRGVFVCFNMATFLATDFAPWNEPVDTFNPTALDISQWLDLYQEFGAKYAVLTVKHVDGFCIWPTTTTPHGLANTTWYATHGNRDITQEFCDECRARNILPVFYFSMRDDRFVNAVGGTQEEFRIFQEAQITELYTRYSPIAAIWLDSTEWWWGGTAYPWTSSQARRDFINNVDPNIIIVNNSHTTSTVDTDVVELEGGNPAADNVVPTEGCWPFSDTWFWNHDGQYMDEASLMGDRIIYGNARNCALLVNIAPNSTGVISDQFASRALQVCMYLGDIPSVSPTHMTNNTTPSPYVTSASSEYGAPYAAYCAFSDALLNSFWSSGTGSLPEYIQIDLGSAQSISTYMTQVRADTIGNQWSAWTLSGSPNGSSWTVVDTRTEPSTLGAGTARFFELSTPQTYRYWRWTITNSLTGTYADCAQLALFP